MATPYLEQQTGRSNASRDIYRQNKEAMGGALLTQGNIDAARSGGTVLSSPSNPNAARDAAASGRQVTYNQGRVGGGSNTVGGSRASTEDYLDMILNNAFASGVPQVQRPQKQAPVPMPRPAWYGNGDDGQVSVTTPDEAAMDKALQSGLSWEAIIGGAAGAGAALAARALWDRAKASPSTKYRPSQSFDGNGQQTGGARTNTPNADILSRNGLVQGQPSNNPNIDAQFYEIFGIPAPVRSGMEPRLTPSQNPNNSAPQTTYVDPYRDNSGIPGPNQTQKRLGDADSSTYRENFGYNDIERRAQDIVDRMEMYGDYDIGKYVDPSADPAVARTVTSILRNMM